MHTSLNEDQVRSASGHFVCDCEQLYGGKEKGIANAAFIVRAVNSHDALVGALQEAKQFMPTYARVATIDAVLAAAKGDK